MITKTRQLSQQLTNPKFDNPKELVSWMGAIQAQDYNMAKWALGIRLKSNTIQNINDSLQKGEILRTHVMRPTWHFVAAEDIRWMLKLSAKRINSTIQSCRKYPDMNEQFFFNVNKKLEKILEGKNLTKQEINAELINIGMPIDPTRMNSIMMQAETEGIVCNGIDKNKKITYSLLEERVPKTSEIHRDEALAKLAIRYFRSHSPASLNDFVWWSGLSVTEARKAIDFIKSELITDKFESLNMYIHQSYNDILKPEEAIHLLPAYDEYLISYKDRSAVLNSEHYPKAFNNYGIFHPIITYNGKVVGNWKRSTKRGEIVIDTSFFEKDFNLDKRMMEAAEDRYIKFLSQRMKD